VNGREVLDLFEQHLLGQPPMREYSVL